MPSHSKLQDEALELLLQLKERGASKGETQRLFDAWAATSPEHAQLSAEVQAVWDGIEQIDELPWPTKEQVLGLTSQPNGHRQARVWSALFRQPWAGIVAASTLVVAITVAMIWAGIGNTDPSQGRSEATYATAKGEHQEIRLADGSSFILGGRSTARTFFSNDVRAVYLDGGEALFNVAKDPNRPFIVYVAQAEVRAIGTAFNVWTNTRQVEVAVIEGVVKVAESQAQPQARLPANNDSGGGTPTVHAVVELAQGQQVSYLATTGMSPVRATDIASVTAWRGGQLVFRGAPLERVIADINRYSSQVIRIRDPAVSALQFTGTVRPALIDQWLSGLPRVFPITVHTRGAEIELSLAQG